MCAGALIGTATVSGSARSPNAPFGQLWLQAVSLFIRPRIVRVAVNDDGADLSRHSQIVVEKLSVCDQHAGFQQEDNVAGSRNGAGRFDVGIVEKFVTTGVFESKS